MIPEHCDHFIHFQSNISFRCNFGEQNEFFVLFIIFDGAETKTGWNAQLSPGGVVETKYVIKDPRIPTCLGYNPHLNMSAERVKQTRVFSGCITSKGLQSVQNAGWVQHRQLAPFLLKIIIFNKQWTWVHKYMSIWFTSRREFSG